MVLGGVLATVNDSALYFYNQNLDNDRLLNILNIIYEQTKIALKVVSGIAHWLLATHYFTAVFTLDLLFRERTEDVSK